MTRRECDFFLYPVVHITARDKREATDRIIEAIFNAGVGEIPGWLPDPPSREEKLRHDAALGMMEALEDIVNGIDAGRERIGAGREERARAALAKWKGE